MNCREFSEIADTYLHDELLVETNMQVHKHLENCADCRKEFGRRRELRQMVKVAMNSPKELEIKPNFENRLRSELRDYAMQQHGWQKYFTVRLMVPAMASLVFIAAITIGLVVNWNSHRIDLANQRSEFTNSYTALLNDAAADHKDCALEKQAMWDAMSKMDSPEKTLYTEKVIKPLQKQRTGNVEYLYAHDCPYDGRIFTHIILRENGHIVSVIIDKSGNIPAIDQNLGDSIHLEKTNGLQVAGFQKGDHAFFVISDLAETDNLNIARTISDVWNPIA
ncbi:MAG: zf-HC2 domain-containing protein [Acidobacteriota bacterium]